MNRILVIEDDTRISDLVQRALRENNFDVVAAFDGEFGKKLALREDFDLVIADIMLPKINGLEVCKELKSQKPQTPVIMLTALGTTDDKLEGFDAGADDYLTKPFDVRELIARINVLLQRKVDFSNDSTNNVLTFGELKMDLNTKEFWRGEDIISLTPKEFNLMEYMLKNANRVLSRTEISEKVWDTHFDTGTNFIDVYINYLRKKVDKKYPTSYIHTQPGMGFILKEVKS